MLYTIYLIIYYIVYFFPLGVSFFLLLCLSGLGREPMVGVREVSTKGVGWSSDEVSDLVATPLNLVLYMHLRIFAYTSNTFITSLEYTESMLATGTLNFF